MKTNQGTIAATLLAGLISVMTSAPSSAQTGWYAVPSVTVTAVSDDNIFFNIDEKTSDDFVRASPALELGYESQQADTHLRYSFDAEKYKELEDLDSTQMRRLAEFNTSYIVSRTLTVNGEAQYIKTNTPLDLSLQAGGSLQGALLGRASATRVSANPSIEFRMSERSDAEIGYRHTRDKLANGPRNTTDSLDTAFNHRYSPSNLIEYGYRYRHYTFDNQALQPGNDAFGDQDSHTPWLGLTHDFSPETSVRAVAGPRLAGDEVNPYVLLAFQHDGETSTVGLSYEKDEGTLLGQGGRQEVETVTATLMRRFGNQFELSIAPGYGTAKQEGQDVEIYRASVNATYRVTEYLDLMAAYDLNSQTADFVAQDSQQIERNVIMIGFTLSYPRRNVSARL